MKLVIFRTVILKTSLIRWIFEKPTQTLSGLKSRTPNPALELASEPTLEKVLGPA